MLWASAAWNAGNLLAIAGFAAFVLLSFFVSY